MRNDSTFLESKKKKKTQLRNFWKDIIQNVGKWNDIVNV